MDCTMPFEQAVIRLEIRNWAGIEEEKARSEHPRVCLGENFRRCQARGRFGVFLAANCASIAVTVEDEASVLMPATVRGSLAHVSETLSEVLLRETNRVSSWMRSLGRRAYKRAQDRPHAERPGKDRALAEGG